MKFKESGESYMPWMMAVEHLRSVKMELKKMKVDNYTSMISLQFSQREPEQTKRALKKKEALLESLREAAEAKKRDRGEQTRGMGQVPKRQRYSKNGFRALHGFFSICFCSTRSWRHLSCVLAEEA